jgi:hypothetical protein
MAAVPRCQEPSLKWGTLFVANYSNALGNAVLVNGCFRHAAVGCFPRGFACALRSPHPSHYMVSAACRQPANSVRGAGARLLVGPGAELRVAVVV